MSEDKALAALDRSLTECARRLMPVIEEVVKNTIPKERGLTDAEIATLCMRTIKTTLKVMNVGIDSRIAMLVIHLVVKDSPPSDEDWNAPQEPYIVGMLPMFVTYQLPLVGDVIAMDGRIPPEKNPILVARRFHPYDGGHVVLHLKIFCPSEQDAEDTWALYQKFMGAETKFHKNQPKEEADGVQEADKQV